MAGHSSLCWFLLALLIFLFPLFGLYSCWRRFPFVEDNLFFEILEGYTMYLNLVYIGFSYVNGRHKPRRLVGCHAKWVYNMIIVCAAITVQKCRGYDYHAVLAMVGFNAEFHALAKLWNIADVGFFDMFLGVLMQMMIFFMLDETYVVSILVMMLCGGIIYYQYCSYSTPTTCVTVLPKEEEDLLKNPKPPV